VLKNLHFEDYKSVYIIDTDSVRTSQWTQCVNVTNEIRWVLLRQTMVIWHRHTHTHTHTVRVKCCVLYF